jgi:hypothetical protein
MCININIVVIAHYGNKCMKGGNVCVLCVCVCVCVCVCIVFMLNCIIVAELGLWEQQLVQLILRLPLNFYYYYCEVGDDMVVLWPPH